MNKIFIIAEAGVNHNGDIKMAKAMIDVAVDAGADAVKFQTFKAEQVVGKNALKAKYQKENSPESENHLEMLKKLELNANAHKELIDYCIEKGIMFISTPFDLESVDLLNELGVKIFKISSGEITNLPLLRKAGSLGKRIIISTGIADLSEIEDAVNVLISAGTSKENITILHCNTAYPTPYKDANLLAMHTIRNKFEIKVGYSDHTLGIEASIAAAALGAAVIEKHFTLDKNMAGPDHKMSLEPLELKTMVKSIRNIEKALGDGVKKTSLSELENKSIVRKSIIATDNIKTGDVFTEKNVSVKRPGGGLSPMLYDDVIGKVAKRDFKEDEFIEL